MRCPSCQWDVPDANRFCGSCGAAVPSPSQLVTATAAAGPAAPGIARDAVGGFTPGSLLAGRYRVVSLLGRGGMGEVYRADDLKLGTPVALKFLPPALSGDPVRRELFLAEVRMARQVAHPNVCRVFDIGDLGPDGGPRFLSMEYIDGEDLASLLLRIGRLPADKALDISRQICAGLAALHDRGVLHRDLKPANVMLDGRGRVRITDFGLAVAADAAGPGGDTSGTPAYMAPEQLAGHGASVRSDIYGLGLLLYEIYTGQRAFSAASLAGVLARKEQDIPPAPSELIGDMDPVVERVILRAIARDPQNRPATVAQVVAALPGGNPLEAVLRAGGTPSPEMVAASGTNEGLSPARAWALLALVVAGAVTAIAAGSTGLLWQYAAPQLSPDVLAARARDTLAALGYSGRPADLASGFEMDLEHLRHLRTQDPVGWRSQRPEPSYLRFWYRESPQPLEAWRFPFQYGNVSRITAADPPLDPAGMALVRLDPGGRLTQLVVVPAGTPGTPSAAAPDWAAFLRRAGFDPSGWRATASERTPPLYADTRAAWHGTWPDTPALAVRFEAAALEGKVVYFEAVYPWTRPARTPPALLSATDRAAIVPLFFILAATVVGTALFAQRNVRAGRGDRRGALRVSGFVFAAMMISWFFGESHVATLWEFALVVMALSTALFAATFCWLAYLAAEPFLRRRWPEVLVTWTRLLAGELRDPLVGRDVLVGCASGTILAAIGIASLRLPEALALPSDMVFADVYGMAYGLQGVVPLLVWRAAQAVMAALACLFLLLLLRLALGSRWAAVAVFVLGGGALAGAGSAHFWMGWFNTAMPLAVFALLLVRVGLLAAVTQFYVFGLFIFFPVTGDFGAWYAGAGVTALLVFGALALFGFTTALGGRPALGRSPWPAA